jgi:outer membrane translocation and assembly module TamA
MLTAHLEQAGSWLWGSYNFWSTSAEARHFVSMGKTVLATRARIATIAPTDNDQAQVPFYRRFFLGGSSTIRGWGRFEVGPLSEGYPIGGLSSFDGAAEVRFPLKGKLGAVAFLDFGNVWYDARDFNFNDLRYAIGPGLRYQTPIGPARFDIGYQLNPIEGLLINGEPQKRQFRLHFSIGQAF